MNPTSALNRACLKEEGWVMNRSIEMTIQKFEVGPLDDREGYHPVTIETNLGNVACRYYEAGQTQRGMVCVGGVGGDFDSPAKGLYPRLCKDLMGNGIAGLRVRFRYPHNLVEATLDVLAGLSFLESQGITDTALVGHSFGGAVVIRAAAVAQSVRTVVTLATQSYGADVVVELPPDCSILLIHGTHDQVLPPSASEYVYRIAHQPKRLKLFKGADHGLDSVADEVYELVRGWIVEQLNAQAKSN
jgi:pimeloyl-ACP methyl ester carboxylesterase